MATNETWAGMIALNLRYDVFCEPCERSVEIDMAKLPSDGKAIGATFRCSQCGAPGRSIVSHRSVARSVPGKR